MRRSTLAVFLALVLGLSLPVFPQQSTTGPEPPPDLDPGLKLDKRIQTVISGVPTYLWTHGCGPTALGMVVGYYDSHGYPDLVVGDASTHNLDVEAMIATDSHDPTCGQSYADHYQDYACPVDYYPSMYSDRSETSPTHTDNCLADFMRTSRSANGNYYGWSWFNDVDNAFVNYVNMVNPSYKPGAINHSFYGYPWEDYMDNIDNNRPMVLLVDTDGNGGTDHFITAVGYDDAATAYGLYNTWDHSLHWYSWLQIQSGIPWGIYGITVLYLGVPDVTSTYPDNGQEGVPVNESIVITFDWDMDVSTCNESTINVIGDESGTHSFTVSYETISKTLTIDPIEEFYSGEQVTVYLTEDVCSVTGAGLDPYHLFRFNTGCCVGTTGNANCSEDEVPDISDITRLIDYLYLSHASLCCAEEADANNSGGEPDISDITRLIDHLYLSQDPLSDCP